MPQFSSSELPVDTVSRPDRAGGRGRSVPWAVGIGVGLLAVVALVSLFSPLLTLAVLLGASGWGCWEVLQGLRNRAVLVSVVPVFAAVIALPVATFLWGAGGLLVALFAGVVIVSLWRCLDARPGVNKGIFAGIFLVLWVPFLVSFAILLLWSGGSRPSWALWELPPSLGAMHLTAILLIVSGTDTFAYLIGSRCGRHLLAPQISPKKTWEGLVGSLLGGTLGGVIAVQFLPESWSSLMIVLPVSLAGALGDLVESFVKRQLKVKDMSTTLPGHGGIMDRMDSVLFALPVGVAGFQLLEWMGM